MNLVLVVGSGALGNVRKTDAPVVRRNVRSKKIRSNWQQTAVFLFVLIVSLLFDCSIALVACLLSLVGYRQSFDVNWTGRRMEDGMDEV